MSNETYYSDSEFKEERIDALITFIIEGVLTLIVCVFGLIGNWLSATILTLPGWKSSITCILLGLTLTDSVILIVVLLGNVLPHLLQSLSMGSQFLTEVYPFMVPYLYFIGSAGKSIILLNSQFIMF